MRTQGRVISLNNAYPLWLPLERIPQWERWHEGAGWEVARLASLHANIMPGDVVYDIGAELGDFSALFATWGARVCLFEPGYRAWPNIAATWQGNNLPPPLGCWPGFLDDQTDDLGQAYLRTRRYQQWPRQSRGVIAVENHFARPEERPDIPHVTLDDYVAASSVIPTVLTIDVEGSEVRVMKGAREVLAAHHPLVFISEHPQIIADTYNYPITLLHDFMAQQDYQRLELAIDHEVHALYWHPDGRRPRELDDALSVPLAPVDPSAIA